MLTCKEYIEDKPVDKVVLHCMDLTRHILKRDVTQTAYKDPSPASSFIEELTNAMDAETDLKAYESAKNLRHKRPKLKRKHARHGSLHVGRHLNGSRRPFSTPYKPHVEKTGKTIFFDIAIPYCERSGKEVEERFKKIYADALYCASQGIPCRVITCTNWLFEEVSGGKRDGLYFYIVIKDYMDPIFPGMWNALRTNALCNTYINVVADFLVGMKTGSHGRDGTLDVAKDFSEQGELVIMDAKRVIDSRKTPK